MQKISTDLILLRIIVMHFGTKSYLKNNRNHTAKQILKEKEYITFHAAMVKFFPR